jgi:acetyl-CoA acyltransferase 1
MISNNRIANLTNQVAPRNGVVLTPASCSSMSSGVGTKHPDDVVVISALRTPIGRANKGSFKDTNPDDLLAAVLAGVVDQSGIAHKEIGDVVVGNVQLGGAYAGPARMAQFRAGYPIDVPINAVNRQCSSGLQACANIAGAIKSGQIDCGVGCGVESMTMGGGVAAGSAKSAVPPANWPKIFENALARDCLTPMGVTAENIAERYGVTRAMQDEMGVNSHAKALAAQANGSYNDEIVSVTTVLKDAEGNETPLTVSKDDGPREGTTLAALAKLKTVFKDDGSVTAGTSSQVSDGAAAVLMMSRAKADSLGLKPIGCFRAYKVTGCLPDEMGVGPAVAIPAALDSVGLTVNDIDVFEINEAFAAQAVYCINKLNIPMDKVNPLGGAIALGHPLGCTGARQIATLLHQLKRTGKKTGVVSMCIGTGMGAAAVLEAE